MQGALRRGSIAATVRRSRSSLTAPGRRAPHEAGPVCRRSGWRATPLHLSLYMYPARDIKNERLGACWRISVMAISRGDEADAWLGPHRAPLIGFVLPLVNGDLQAAEDVVQETMLRGWQHSTELEPEHAGSWLHAVARNIAISVYHRRRCARPRGSWMRTRCPRPTTASTRCPICGCWDRPQLAQPPLTGRLSRNRSITAGRWRSCLAFRRAPCDLAASTLCERCARPSRGRESPGHELSDDDVTGRLCPRSGNRRERRRLEAHLRGCQECQAELTAVPRSAVSGTHGRKAR
jgi:sigma-70-like protein